MKIISNIFVLMLVLAGAVNAQGYKVGDYAEDFRLKNVSGNMVSMADYPDAKGFVVIFTCNHCPYSIAYEDRIIALNKEFASKGYPVIAINPNDPSVSPEDSYDKMIVRANEKGFTFPYLFDEGQKIYPKYGATRTPHVFILKRENTKYQVVYIGAIDDNSQDEKKVEKKFAFDVLNALSLQQEITTSETKAVGCSIKAKK